LMVYGFPAMTTVFLIGVITVFLGVDLMTTLP
jgi:hypothetical protein